MEERNSAMNPMDGQSREGKEGGEVNVKKEGQEGRKE